MQTKVEKKIYLFVCNFRGKQKQKKENNIFLFAILDANKSRGKIYLLVAIFDANEMQKIENTFYLHPTMQIKQEERKKKFTFFFVYNFCCKQTRK